MRWLAVIPIVFFGAIASCNRYKRDPGSLYRTLEKGEYAEARAEAERLRGDALKNSDGASAAQFGLVVCEALIQQGSHDDALKCLAGIPDSSVLPEVMARREMLRAQALIKQAKYADASASVQSAYQLAGTSGSKTLLPLIEATDGSLHVNQRDWDGAERILKSALAHAREAGLQFVESTVLLNLGTSRLRRGHYDDATGYFERAAALAGSKWLVLLAAAQSNLASCYYQLGEFDRGIALHQQAIERDEHAGARQYLGEALGNAATGFILKGEPQHAIPLLERALAIAREIHRDDLVAVWAGNLSQANVDLEKWDEADRSNREAMAIKKAAGSQTLIYNIFYGAIIAFGQGKTTEAMQLYREAVQDEHASPGVMWNAYDGLGSVAMEQHRTEEASEYYEKAIGIIENTRSGLREGFRLTFFARLVKVYQHYVQALVSQKKVKDALAVADGSRAQMMAIRSGISAGTRLAPDAFPRLAAERQAVILSYWLEKEQSYVWAVTKDGVACYPLGPAAQIKSAVAAYRRAIEERLSDPARTGSPEGMELFRLLVQPAAAVVPRGANVIIVPDGVLHGLNFDTLLNPEGGPHYWIEDVSISIVPSLRLLKPSRPRPDSPSKLLLLGAPESGDPAYPALKYAEKEIESVARQFPQERQLMFRGAAATPAVYRQSNPGQYSMLHFAAHAVANRESPLDSAVLLSGGKLYARDVLEASLNARLVTISACRGAGSREYSGEGMVGFAWAFLSAGAENVIAGIWDVDDQSTATLMESVYRELAAGKTPGAALRQAKLSLLHSNTSFRKPYYWAAFQLYTVTP
jgi:CHAT domain-containing protein/Tfp pilus assembly protein PilF